MDDLHRYLDAQFESLHREIAGVNDKLDHHEAYDQAAHNTLMEKIKVIESKQAIFAEHIMLATVIKRVAIGLWVLLTAAVTMHWDKVGAAWHHIMGKG